MYKKIPLKIISHQTNFFVNISQSSLNVLSVLENTKRMVVSTIDIGGNLEEERGRSHSESDKTIHSVRLSNATGRLIHALGFARVKKKSPSSTVLSIAQPQWLGCVAKTSLDRYENTYG